MASAAVFLAHDAMINPAIYAYKAKKVRLAWSLLRGWFAR